MTDEDYDGQLDIIEGDGPLDDDVADHIDLSIQSVLARMMYCMIDTPTPIL